MPFLSAGPASDRQRGLRPTFFSADPPPAHTEEAPWLPHAPTTSETWSRQFVGALGCSVYDVEVTGSGEARTVRVLIDREGGVDLDAIADGDPRDLAAARRRRPRRPAPYLLEVSSPGLERPLRTPAHFAAARSARRSASPSTPRAAPRRVRGVCVAADDDGFVVDADGTVETIPYDAVTEARTVFEWGRRRRPSPQAGEGDARRRSHERRASTQAAGCEKAVGTMNPEMMEALSALAVEKGISIEIMLEALANALVTAYKRMPDAAEEALVEIDIETGDDPGDRAGARRRGQRHPRVGRHARPTSVASPRRPPSR